MRAIMVAVAVTFVSGTAVAQEFKSPPPKDSLAALNAPLFSSHETLELRIELPIRQLQRDRDDDEEEREAMFWVTAPEQHAMRSPVDIRTRGHFRLQRSTCEFPPLRLDFPKDSLDGTALEGENRLKLTTHCQNKDDQEQRTLQEYLIYRMYNLVTDKSFRVRLARIKYVDSERGDSLTRYGFLIEDDDRMAARNGMIILEMEGLGPEAMEPAALVQLAIFHYMIGNTDWAVGPEKHNIDVIVDEMQIPFAVPFDFDWSGLISAPYAKPDPSLGIRHVRDRLFFLGCLPMDQMEPFIDVLRNLRPQFEELVKNQEGMKPDTKEDTLKYLEGFYDIVNNSRRANRELRRRC